MQARDRRVLEMHVHALLRAAEHVAPALRCGKLARVDDRSVLDHFERPRCLGLGCGRRVAQTPLRNGRQAVEVDVLLRILLHRLGFRAARLSLDSQERHLESRRGGVRGDGAEDPAPGL